MVWLVHKILNELISRYSIYELTKAFDILVKDLYIVWVYDVALSIRSRSTVFHPIKFLHSFHIECEVQLAGAMVNGLSCKVIG
jgi:hypothetical protein